MVVGVNLQFWGGVVDLVSLNKIFLDGGGIFGKDILVGKNIFFGVCEFGMVVVVNGINFYGGIWVFGSIFLVFIDYLWVVIC